MMLTRLIIILTILAIISLIGAIIIFRKNRNPEIWIKYWVYLLLIAFNISIIHYQSGHYYVLAAIISALSFYEILKVAKTLRLRTQLSFLYLPIFGLFIFMSHKANTSFLLHAYFITAVFDGFSQITGQLLGKLRPFQISPNKTAEGVIGGFLAALISTYILLDGHRSTAEVTILVLLVSFVALLGDLLASFVKRKCAVKDFSNIIPGHGGILDRFDSWVVSGIAYFFLKIIGYEI